LVWMLAICWLIRAAVCASMRPVSQTTVSTSSDVSQRHGTWCACSPHICCCEHPPVLPMTSSASMALLLDRDVTSTCAHR
jgi:hypothetical protein